jgi:hypothetical protein
MKRTVIMGLCLVLGGCASTPSPATLAQYDKQRAECHSSGHLRYFGQELSGLNQQQCNERITFMAAELERWYQGGAYGGAGFSYTFIAQ